MYLCMFWVASLFLVLCFDFLYLSSCWCVLALVQFGFGASSFWSVFVLDFLVRRRFGFFLGLIFVRLHFFGLEFSKHAEFCTAKVDFKKMAPPNFAHLFFGAVLGFSASPRNNSATTLQQLPTIAMASAAQGGKT